MLDTIELTEAVAAGAVAGLEGNNCPNPQFLIAYIAVCAMLEVLDQEGNQNA